MEYFYWLIGKVFSWALGALFVALIIFVMNLMAKTGRLLRRGVEIKKSLHEGWVYSSSNDAYGRKATLYIVFPILLWIALYMFVWVRYSLAVFGMALLLLICPIVGYTGYKFTRGE